MKQSWFLFFMMVALILGAALPAAVQGNELPSSADGSSESATSVAPELLFLLLRGSAEDEENSSDIEDSDADGVSDETDQCGSTPPDASVDANGCSASQLDTDNDGVTDDLDQCPNTPNGATVDDTGCAPSQLDADNDSVADDIDQCPNTPNGAGADANGCADSQLDDDNDTVSNDVDQCPATPTDETADATGCSPSQLDTDNDGVTDDIDQCPNTSPGVAVDDQGCEDTSGSLKDDYIQNVHPLITDFQKGCTSSGCHGKGNAPGGLSLYGSNVAGSDQLNYDSLVSYIDRSSVTRLLGKLSGTLAHGGGVRYGTGTAGYQVIKTWAEAVDAEL